MKCAARLCVSDGFHTTTLPLSAQDVGKFPAIAVKLNGVIILDADLGMVREPKVLAKHPGISRTSGHIGFLGHGSLVEFRNIRVRKL